MAKHRFIWLVLAGMLLAGMVIPAAVQAQAQAVQVTMGIDGMV